MYGVSSDLPLQRFVGYECNLIGLGRFQIQFHFSGVGVISAESGWELRDVHGTIVDAHCEHADRNAYGVHKIIDVPVTSFSIDAPRSFTLFFASGHGLTVFDDSDRYETCSISLDGHPLIII